jgi:molybdopterin adenylyltransferase
MRRWDSLYFLILPKVPAAIFRTPQGYGGSPGDSSYNQICMVQTTVITVSDSRSQGKREDLSGPAITQELKAQGFDVRTALSVADDRKAIEDALHAAAIASRLVITTGGTGIAPRDVTPEATRNVCSRFLDGIPELMRAEGRKETQFAALSRGLCGTIATPDGESLVLNLPGNPKGAVTSLRIVLPLLHHALALISGQTQHEGDAA